MENNEEFYSLAPKAECKQEKYIQAFDKVFKDPSIKNVAVTGIYGAGKTTVWHGYAENHELEKVITVSLGRYGNNENNENNENVKNDGGCENRVERQIINQIVSQINPKEIPLSKYRIKSNKGFFLTLAQTVSLTAFTLSIILWFYRGTIGQLGDAVNKTYWMDWISVVCLILFIVPTFYGFYLLTRNNKYKISKVGFQGAEASVDCDKDDDTVLSREMREIVYLLKSAKAKVVVFEDLDRYDSITIFSKLKELNFLLNSTQVEEEKPAFIKRICKKWKRITSSDDKSEQGEQEKEQDKEKDNEDTTVKFIYMVRDGLFSGKERVKFFDFIVPIVPVVDSTNSKDWLIKELASGEGGLDRKVIRRVSLYIDDMRLAKNIVNEYRTYKGIVSVEALQLDLNKLFALIVLKNLCPQEFDQLQENRGYIFDIIKGLKGYQLAKKSQYSEELKEIDEDLQEPLINNYEKCYRFIKRSIRPQTKLIKPKEQFSLEFLQYWASNPSNTCEIEYIEEGPEDREKPHELNLNYHQFLGFIFGDTLEQKINEEIRELKQKKEEVVSRIRRVESAILQDKLLELEGEETLENILEDLEIEVDKIPLWGLIKLLISDGLLSEMYWQYKGIFYGVSEGKNDRIFLKNLFESKKFELFLPLENPMAVQEYLQLSDYSKPNILNYQLFECCIEQKMACEISRMLDTIKSYGTYADFAKMLFLYEYSTIKEFVSIVIQERKIQDISTVLQYFKGNKKKTGWWMLREIFTRSNMAQSDLAAVRPYIEEEDHFIYYIPDDLEEAFVHNLEVAQVKFTCIPDLGVKKDRIGKIEKIKGYKLTPANVKVLAEILLSKTISYSRLITEVFSSDLGATQKYIDENFSMFIKKYVDDNSSKESFLNDEDIVCRVIESEISEETKLEYLKYNKTKISNLTSISSIRNKQRIIECLLATDGLELTGANIEAYWDSFSTFNKELGEYLNRNLDTNNFKEVLGDNKELTIELLNWEQSEPSTFEYALQCASRKIPSLNDQLSKERVQALVKHSLVEINQCNLQLMVNLNYDEAIIGLMKNKDGHQEEEDGCDNAEDAVIEILYLLEIPSRLVYTLINSEISESNIGKMEEKLDSGLELRKIDLSKDGVMRYVLHYRLSGENVGYLCRHFDKLGIKEEFLGALVESRNLEGSRIVLRANGIASDYKIRLIIGLIDEGINEIDLKGLIALVPEISLLKTVWEEDSPAVDTEAKKRVADALEKNGYVKYYDVEGKRTICLDK